MHIDVRGIFTGLYPKPQPAKKVEVKRGLEAGDVLEAEVSTQTGILLIYHTRNGKPVGDDRPYLFFAPDQEQANTVVSSLANINNLEVRKLPSNKDRLIFTLIKNPT